MEKSEGRLAQYRSLIAYSSVESHLSLKHAHIT